MSAKPVFISYSHTNIAIVDRLKADLLANNIPLWLDHESLTPGTPNWGTAIRQGIQSAQALVYVASPKAQESDNVVSEIEIAKRYQIPIYPFWVEGEHWIDVAPVGMGRTQHIDARTDYMTAFQQLLKHLSSTTNLQPASPQEIAYQQPKRLSSGTASHILNGHTNIVSSIAWSPTSKRLTTGSWDNTARIWDAQTGQSLLTLIGHTDWVRSVAWCPDDKRLATASADQTAHIWGIQTGQPLLTLTHRSSVDNVAWSPDGKRLATDCFDQVYIWNAQNGQPLLTLGPKGSTFIDSIAWSPDGNRLAITCRYLTDPAAYIYDAQTGQFLLTLKDHTGEVINTTWSPDGNRLTSQVTSITWSPDSEYLATASDDKTARIWDAQIGESLLTLKGHTDSITSIAWSPDGSRIATASEDTTARIWELT